MRRPHLTAAAADGQLDTVDRLKMFEVAHPDVTVVPPVQAWERWRAIVPLGDVPGKPDTTAIGSYELAGMMDQLDGIYPPDSC